MRTACFALVFLCLNLVSRETCAASEKSRAMLTNIVGTVEWKGAEGTVWKRATLMALLGTGDVLRTGEASSATVVFFTDSHLERIPPKATVRVRAMQLQPLGDMKRISVPSLEKVPPAGRTAILVQKGGPVFKAISQTAAGRYGAVGIRATGEPILLSPLRPKTRSNRPLFAWAAVEGADTYEVRLEDRQGKVLFQRETADAQLAYPEELPPLVRNAGYRWQVQAKAGGKALARNSTEFHVLAAQSVATLSQQEAAIKRSVPSGRDTTVHILLARLYMDYGLCAEAIQQLEEAVAINPSDPALHEELVPLYEYVGHGLAAQKAAERAAKLRGEREDG